MTGLEKMLEDLVRRIVREELDARDRDAGDADLITTEQAAARLGMSPSYIRDARRAGRLPAKRIGRAVRFAIADVDALATKRAPSLSTSAVDWAASVKLAGGRR